MASSTTDLVYRKPLKFPTYPIFFVDWLPHRLLIFPFFLLSSTFFLVTLFTCNHVIYKVKGVHGWSKMKNGFRYGGTQYRLQKYILIAMLLLNFDFIGLLNLLGLSHCDAGCFEVYSSHHLNGQAQGYLKNRLNKNLIKALWSGCISAAHNECLHTRIHFSFSDLNA